MLIGPSKIMILIARTIQASDQSIFRAALVSRSVQFLPSVTPTSALSPLVARVVSDALRPALMLLRRSRRP